MAEALPNSNGDYLVVVTDNPRLRTASTELKHVMVVKIIQIHHHQYHHGTTAQ
jgi:hypothetical protein